MPTSATPSRKVVAVTGASGYVATRLIEALCRDDAVERVLGFDIRPPQLSSDKFFYDEVDVRNPNLEQRFGGVDVVVHLAFVMDPIKDEALMRGVNVHGSQNVFRCAGRAGVPRIVYTSSATVYGAHPDNDVPLTEESPLRANLDFSYPAHKLEVEYVAREFLEEFPDTKMVIFRPAIVFGPHVDNAWSHTLELPLLFGVKGHSPPIQFIHEDDVVRALEFAVFGDIDGVFNVAPENWLEADDALAIVGRRRFDLSEPTAFSLAERLWNMGMAEAPPGMLQYLMHPWVVSAQKLADAGFAARISSADTLRQTVDAVGAYLRVGRTRVRRFDLVRGAAAGAGLMAALAGYRTLRSRASA